MDVPFSSSGAISRAHYALVRKIETATPQAADQILLAEVHTIRTQLARSTLTLVSLKQWYLYRTKLIVVPETMQGVSGPSALLLHGCKSWRVCESGICAPSCHKSRRSSPKGTRQTDRYVRRDWLRSITTIPYRVLVLCGSHAARA